MGSRGLLLLKGAAPKHHIFNNTKGSIFSSKMPTRYYYYDYDYNNRTRNCSTTTTRSSLEPPDVPRLAQTARISLTPHEVEEFAPKIRQVIDWFGQLQDVDLDSVDPALRAGSKREKNTLCYYPRICAGGTSLIIQLFCLLSVRVYCKWNASGMLFQ
ncbi:hypothetical protein CISIN_1g031606mg [Citrus sinensis]|uniref:Glutamyl-tRNA(Gln) amidotransferase subunit C, chloroplastic/mitochondrial n=1 Tax=Citrus sinensis TaxID=2711 RepID=A0A067GWV3_CITSI|nr:hypothetical protein CISIN_1g031606mg [Citrus sinensis]